MADLQRYFDFVRRYPQRFTNDPDGIEILLDPEQIAEAEHAVEEKLQRAGLPLEWAKVGVAFQDQYLLIVRDAVRFPDGSLGTYFRMTSMEEGVPGVVILPFYRNKIILERHYRHGPRTWLIEIPRGFGEPGLTPEENARREIQEEIGATVSRIESLGTLYVNSSMIGGYDCLFYAELDSLGDFEKGEGISGILQVSLSEFERMIAANEITDGFTLAAYARAKAKGLLVS
jgi:ADP-ribose pyrophosphatase